MLSHAAKHGCVQVQPLPLSILNLKENAVQQHKVKFQRRHRTTKAGRPNGINRKSRRRER
jgi:hypothetical protein